MIVTDIEMKSRLWKLTSESDLAKMITGAVYKDRRPTNSDKEDILISVIARDAGSQIQQATANVNIYVEDIRRGEDSVESPRLKELCEKSAEVFEYRNFGDWIMELDSQEVMEALDVGWHIINNRVRLRFNNETTT